MTQQIKLTNVTDRKSPAVERLMRLLDGQTYMRFNILVCPVGGSCDVLAETDYNATKEEVTEFLLFVLASQNE